MLEPSGSEYLRVTELRDRLQDAVGSAYTIERELGGGGMSRVFVARERDLDRQVVIKVLAPELAAGVSLERFRREIQLAAALQHPHIVPLLAAGQSGDVLYYVMPYVEGESLRARLSRDGRFPVADTVRLLSDVADALAYAHRQGVVHRDIKPDNILLSAGHAVITDFGVAKALDAAHGVVTGAGGTGAVLTTAGLAMGTPAYMAPEQAAADPATDHRADIYAVGTLAYEMLAGRPPFTGMSPAATLAAQVTTPPDALTDHRHDAPPELTAVIMKCLEKKPSERWQDAAVLAAELDALVTPSSGSRAWLARISSGSFAGVVRRTGVPLALGLYLLASLVTVAVIRALTLAMGLPDWVVPATLAVLLAGLGLLIWAALGRAPWLTRRRALVGGLAALGLPAVAGTAYLAMQAAGIGPMGSLVGAGKLAMRDRVLVAEFDNRTTDSLLGQVVTEALRTDLTQSPIVSVVPNPAVREALLRMARPDTSRLDFDLARELAIRDGIKAVVAGDIAAVGPQYVVSARLVVPESGEVLAAYRETARDSSAIIGAIDRLSKRMRERTGESLRTIRAMGPLDQVTTTSLDALRKYSQAVHVLEDDLDSRSGSDRAIALLDEAVTLDSTFGMAWRKLAVVLSNLGDQVERQDSAFARSFRLRDRMTALERYLTDGSYYQLVSGDLDRAAVAYRAALDLDPNSGIAINNLGLIYMERRQYAEAESLYYRLAGRDVPTKTGFANLIEAELALGKFDAADSLLNIQAAKNPDNPLVAFGRSQVAVLRGEYDIAEAELQAARKESDGNPDLQAKVTYSLAAITALRGRLAESSRYQQEAVALKRRSGDSLAAFRGAVEEALMDVWLRGDKAGGVRRLDSVLARTEVRRPPPAKQTDLEVANVYALAGRADRARTYLARHEAASPAMSAGRRRQTEAFELVVRGNVALAEGRPAEAITDFQQANEVGWPLMALPQLGRAYEAAGRPDSAVAVYRRYLETPAGYRLGEDAFELPTIYRVLGQLYEASGDRQLAVEFYGKLLELYRNSDPEFQPLVADVRYRLQALKSVTG